MANPKHHVVKTGKNNYSATDKQGNVIHHSGKMTKAEAGKQVQAIWLSQHKGK